MSSKGKAQLAGNSLDMIVVLLPGLEGTGDLFKPLIEILAEEIETLVISYPPNTRLNYQELTELVISQLPREKFILVGESFSGYIAYQVALRKPENLQSVVFVATFLRQPRPFLLRLCRLLPKEMIFSAPIPEFFIKTCLFDWAVTRQMIDLFKQAIKQVSPNVLSFRLEQISKLPKNHKNCEIRATYIQATDDKLVPKSCVESFKKVFINLNVFQIEGSHFILQTNPLACATVIVNEITL